MNYLATAANPVASGFAVPRSAAQLVWDPWFGVGGGHRALVMLFQLCPVLLQPCGLTVLYVLP